MARRSIRRLMVGAVCGVSTSALVLSGCALVGYSIAADDPCRSERQELKVIGDFLIEETAKGAFLGAILGAAIGGAAGRDGSSVALGAAAGARAGGLGSYFLTKQKM
jgi:hypothetical protein